MFIISLNKKLRVIGISKRRLTQMVLLEGVITPLRRISLGFYWESFWVWGLIPRKKSDDM